MSRINNILSKLPNPYVILLIGPPLVGKTSFIKEAAGVSLFEVVSRDQIIMDMANTDNYEEAYSTVNQREVDSQLKSRIESLSKLNSNVIVDMTNLSSKRRRTTLRYFGKEYYKVGIVFPIVDWEEMKKRNEKREREEKKHIGEHIIKRMIGSYQSIRPEEGFNKVISL